MPLQKYAEQLERLYVKYARRRYVHPDPLELLYGYEDPCDREVAGLVAALLAYGRVKQILRSASGVLDRLGPRLARAVSDAKPAQLERTFAEFRHRFQTSRELVPLLVGIRGVIHRHGSLGQCFSAGADKRETTVLPALQHFVGEINVGAKGRCGHLLPDPARGSACKRLHLYLRWMVRRDRVDPGGWDAVSPAGLIVPLDTHMHQLCTTMGVTKRKSATLTTALEATAAFRAICPDDPVRYDFALTRLGIRSDTNPEEFFSQGELH